MSLGEVFLHRNFEPTPFREFEGGRGQRRGRGQGESTCGVLLFVSYFYVVSSVSFLSETLTLLQCGGQQGPVPGSGGCRRRLYLLVKVAIQARHFECLIS